MRDNFPHEALVDLLVMQTVREAEEISELNPVDDQLQSDNGEPAGRSRAEARMHMEKLLKAAESLENQNRESSHEH